MSKTISYKRYMKAAKREEKLLRLFCSFLDGAKVVLFLIFFSVTEYFLPSSDFEGAFMICLTLFIKFLIYYGIVLKPVRAFDNMVCRRYYGLQKEKSIQKMHHMRKATYC